MDDMDLVTPAEAAKILNVSRQAIYHAIRDQRLPSRRVLGHLGIPRSALKDFEPDPQRLQAGKASAKKARTNSRKRREK